MKIGMKSEMKIGMKSEMEIGMKNEMKIVMKNGMRNKLISRIGMKIWMGIRLVVRIRMKNVGALGWTRTLKWVSN